MSGSAASMIYGSLLDGREPPTRQSADVDRLIPSSIDTLSEEELIERIGALPITEQLLISESPMLWVPTSPKQKCFSGTISIKPNSAGKGNLLVASTRYGPRNNPSQSSTLLATTAVATTADINFARKKVNAKLAGKQKNQKRGSYQPMDPSLSIVELTWVQVLDDIRKILNQ